MSFLTEDLLKKEPYQYQAEEKTPGGAFYRALMEELCFHYETNEAYRRFCGSKGFDPHTFSDALELIPPVQVSVFKELGGKLSSVPQQEIKLSLQSSATSGVPSTVPVDKITSKRQARAMIKVVSEFIGNERRPFLIMDVNPAEGFRQQLGARYAAVSGYLNFAAKTAYFLKVDKKMQYYFDVDGIKSYTSGLEKDTPAVVFGFTYILYSHVIRPLYESGQTVFLPAGSKIIHIGGWKKLESEKIGREEFNQKAAQVFGIIPDDVIDIYGFTEQMGLNYPDCRCGYKHAPLYAEVIVRDIATKEKCPPGTAGLLEFLSPIPHSYPGNVVLTDDIGVIEEGPCPCGRAGTRFKVLGRLKKAEVRGCGDILSSKLIFAGSGPQTQSDRVSGYRIEYAPRGLRLDGMDPEDSLKAIEQHLKSRLEWLRQQPIDALIGLIAQVAGKWAGMGTVPGKLQALQTNGLNFLASWCTVEHLTAMMTDGLRGNRMYADSFLPCPDSTVQYRAAVSRGLACHWLAGNVQVLGMFVLLESILTKNVNLLKLSSRDDGVFKTLLSAFEGEVFVTPGGYRILGDELLQTVALVYYDHEDSKLGRLMSEMADVRIAWGGKESVTAVAAYPAKYDCESIIMGPKLSFSVISAEALDSAHAAKKLARKTAIDASVFDQTGCASAHNVFVETGGAVSPDEFAGILADAMRKTALQIPKGRMSPEQLSAIHSVRGLYDFKGIVYGDSEGVWTVLYSEDMQLNSPVYSRVVFVHPVNCMDDVLPYVDDTIQTVGLAAEGEKAIRFALQASRAGAMRFPVCGRMLNFDLPWDGMYLTDKLVRWVTLGGPAV